MDGGENRQTNMDVILAVARRSRREFYGASGRSYGATACNLAAGKYTRPKKTKYDIRRAAYKQPKTG
jgi:hypothetical protein